MTGFLDRAKVKILSFIVLSQSFQKIWHPFPKVFLKQRPQLLDHFHALFVCFTWI